MKQRQISEKMLNAFLSGELSSLLEAVKKDDTLDLELRGSSANIYYRGGSIFKITEKANNYTIFFDRKYCMDSPEMYLSETPSIKEAVDRLPFYKQAMDWYFHKHPKYEREFQQLIVRENNAHNKISKSTDYYIVDIEFADNDARFDMIALKWPSTSAARKDVAHNITLALIEVKYGDDSLDGSSGIQKHLKDFQRFLAPQNEAILNEFCKDMSQVFLQKCKLGLVAGLNEKQYNVTISPQDLEVIFIFANHDPEKHALSNNLEKINPDDYDFPIMIAKSSNMGYGLYFECLQKLPSSAQLK